MLYLIDIKLTIRYSVNYKVDFNEEFTGQRTLPNPFYSAKRSIGCNLKPLFQRISIRFSNKKYTAGLSE